MTTTTQPPAVGSELCSSTCDPCGYSFSLQHPFGQIDAVKIGGESKTCNTHGQRPKLTQDSVMQYCRENACSRARHDPEFRVEPSTTAERNVRGGQSNHSLSSDLSSRKSQYLAVLSSQSQSQQHSWSWYTKSGAFTRVSESDTAPKNHVARGT